MSRHSTAGAPSDLRGLAHTLQGDNSGVAAVEFAFFALFLSVALLNVVDIATYTYQRMQVENAAEMGAQAVFAACDLTKVPATTNCSGLNTTITNASQSTSLGNRVTLASGYPTEGWYCVNTSGSLQYVSPVSSKPADCSAAGMPTLQPGDYINVRVTFTYVPVFSGITVASLLPATITKSSTMRLQ